jgi:hypothetical protein
MRGIGAGICSYNDKSNDCFRVEAAKVGGISPTTRKWGSKDFVCAYLKGEREIPSDSLERILAVLNLKVVGGY